MNSYISKFLTGMVYGAGGGLGLAITWSVYIYAVNSIDSSEKKLVERKWPIIEEVTAEKVRYWKDNNKVYLLVNVKNNSKFETEGLIVDVVFMDAKGKPVDGERKYVSYVIRPNEID